MCRNYNNHFYFTLTYSKLLDSEHSFVNFILQVSVIISSRTAMSDRSIEKLRSKIRFSHVLKASPPTMSNSLFLRLKRLGFKDIFRI